MEVLHRGQSVIHSVLETLLAAQVPVRCLDRNMRKEKLNLFEFTACLMTKPCTCPPQIMRRD